MSNIHIILAKEARPSIHKRRKEYRIDESNSIKKLNDNMVKMEKGFIKGISLSSIRLTHSVYTFIEKNNLEITNDRIQLKR